MQAVVRPTLLLSLYESLQARFFALSITYRNLLLFFAFTKIKSVSFLTLSILKGIQIFYRSNRTRFTLIRF